MTHIFTPNPSGDQFITGRFTSSKPKPMSSHEVDILGGESGTPFPGLECCDGVSGGGGPSNTYTLDSSGSDINLIENGSVSAGMIDICDLINSNCSPGYSLQIAGQTLRLRNFSNTTISTVNLPIPSGGGGVVAPGFFNHNNSGDYIFDDGLGNLYAIEYEIVANGPSVELVGSNGDVTSSVDICQLVNTECDLGAALDVSGDSVVLVNGDGNIISSTPFPVYDLDTSGTVLILNKDGSDVDSIDICPLMAGCGYEPVAPAWHHGVAWSVPDDVGFAAAAHFWDVNTASGDIDFTPVDDGKLPDVIANAGAADKFVFTNIGLNNMTFTAANGVVYTFGFGDVMTLMRMTIGLDDEYYGLL